MSSNPLLTNVPIPLTDPIATPRDWKLHPNPKERDPNEGLITEPWNGYYQHNVAVGAATPVRVNTVTLVEQAASIGATDLAATPLTAGLYLLHYYFQITRAGTVSSSLIFDLDWRYNSQTLTFTGATESGNGLTDYQQDTLILKVSSSSPVRYSTTYASSGATAMQYALSVVLIKVNA